MNFEKNSYSEILKSIQPVLTLSRLFGIMPLCCKDNKKLAVSRLAMTYSTLIFIVYLIHALLMPLFVLHLNIPGHQESSAKEVVRRMIDIVHGKITAATDMKNPVQTLTMKIINPILLSLIALCAHWIALIKMPDEFAEIINSLSKADEFLRTKFSVDYSMVCKKQLSYCYKSCIIFIIIGLAINGYYLFIIYKTWGVSVTLFWCSLLSLGNITAQIMELQFTNLVNLLTVRFETLNKQIYGYIEKKHSADFFSRYQTLANFKVSKKVMPMPGSIANSFLLADLGVVKTDITLASIMESSRHFHRDLCGLVTSINQLYQWQLLCSLVTCFIRSVLNFYFCIFGFSSATGVPPYYTYEFSGFISLICWSLFYTFRFTNLVFSADRMSREAKKAKPIAAAINNRFLDNESKGELLLFSNYMASCKVEFTANGLFTLNTHLITSAIGAGTTYLVILVQFQAN